jgi:hypothetical protein
MILAHKTGRQRHDFIQERPTTHLGKLSFAKNIQKTNHQNVKQAKAKKQTTMQ